MDYRTVILHAVLRHDGTETRRRDGAIVPILELGPVLADLPSTAGIEAADWARFGNGVCAPELARRRPEQIRMILRRLGDARLAAKAARLEARLTDDPPAEVLYQELWDGFGFSANREPMHALAALLPLAALEDAMATVPAARRPALARGLLFGAGGFFPLSPVDAVFAYLYSGQVRVVYASWSIHGGTWHGNYLSTTVWT